MYMKGLLLLLFSPSRVSNVLLSLNHNDSTSLCFSWCFSAKFDWQKIRNKQNCTSMNTDNILSRKLCFHLCPFVGWFVCALVCRQDYTKTTERISAKQVDVSRPRIKIWIHEDVFGQTQCFNRSCCYVFYFEWCLILKGTEKESC